MTDEQQAWFEFKEGRYYIGVWYLELPPEVTWFKKGGNMTAMISRADADPTHWEIVVRLRHYRDGRIHQHADESRGWRLLYEGTEAEAERKLMEMLMLAGLGAAVIARTAVAVVQLEFFEVRGDNAAFQKALAERPPAWLHCDPTPDAKTFAE